LSTDYTDLHGFCPQITRIYTDFCPQITRINTDFVQFPVGDWETCRVRRGGSRTALTRTALTRAQGSRPALPERQVFHNRRSTTCGENDLRRRHPATYRLQQTSPPTPLQRRGEACAEHRVLVPLSFGEGSGVRSGSEVLQVACVFSFRRNESLGRKGGNALGATHSVRNVSKNI
jgi:hypothetical protein